MDAEPAQRAGPRLDAASVQNGAFTHPGDPVASRCAVDCSWAPAVIRDLQLECIFAPPDTDLGARRRGVLDRVCKSFLDDPIRAEVERGRQHRGFTVDEQIGIEA
jgi:hypothetical protein